MAKARARGLQGAPRCRPSERWLGQRPRACSSGIAATRPLVLSRVQTATEKRRQEAAHRVPARFRFLGAAGRRLSRGERLSPPGRSDGGCRPSAACGRNAELSGCRRSRPQDSAAGNFNRVAADPFQPWPRACWRRSASAQRACNIGRSPLIRPRTPCADPADKRSFAVEASSVSLLANCTDATRAPAMDPLCQQGRGASRVVRDGADHVPLRNFREA